MCLWDAIRGNAGCEMNRAVGDARIALLLPRWGKKGKRRGGAATTTGREKREKEKSWIGGAAEGESEEGRGFMDAPFLGDCGLRASTGRGPLPACATGGRRGGGGGGGPRAAPPTPGRHFGANLMRVRSRLRVMSRLLPVTSAELASRYFGLTTGRMIASWVISFAISP
jgi:hypothetical protein